MKTRTMYEVRNRYLGLAKHPFYDAYCKQCDHVSTGWDYRRNALRSIREHLLEQHHIVPGVSVQVTTDGWEPLEVMVFGTADADIARALARHKLSVEYDLDDDALAILETEPRSFIGNIVPAGPDNPEGFGWFWMANLRGRAHAIGWELQ